MARGRPLELALPASAAAVAVVILGPLLLPGYPMRYDLVGAPQPVLGADALGLGDRLPRAVPLDAVVALLALVLPDDAVLKVLAVAGLTLAGWGAGRLTPVPLPGRLVAVLVAQWNPFVAEQLAIGHVPHLLAYGALPWVAIRAHELAAAVDRRSCRLPLAGLVIAVALGSLTPGGGLLCAVAALAGTWAGRDGGAPRPKGSAWCVPAGLAATAVLQLPWVVAGIVHPAARAGISSEAAREGVAAFAVRSETDWGRAIDVLGLGGMWNAAALPASRHGVLSGIGTLFLLALAGAGTTYLPRLIRAGRGAEVTAAACAAAAGYAVALLPVAPGGERLLAWLVGTVPGVGLLRDGHRWLALPALCVAVLCGLGAEVVATRARRSGRQPLEPAAQPAVRSRRAAVAIVLGCLVVACIPDLAGGISGRLAARNYPPQWQQVRDVLDASPDNARILVLPWQPFRRFSWSGPAPVLDPALRLLPRQVLASDALTVSGRRLPAEGAGAQAVSRALADGVMQPEELGSLRVGWVLVERGTPGRLPTLPDSWTPVHSSSQLLLLRAPDRLPVAEPASTPRRIVVGGAHVAAGLLVLIACGLVLASRSTGRLARSRR